MEYFTCTEGDTGPILDILWGGLTIAGAINVASDPSVEGGAATVALDLSWSAVSAVAAVTGFKKSRRCRAALLQLAQRQQARPARAEPAPGDSSPPSPFIRARGARAEPAPGDGLVQAVVIRPGADTLTVGEQIQLAATAHASTGAVVANKTFFWSSSNDAIASVGSNGLVTAHTTGSVVIAARTDNVVGTTTVVVVQRR